MNSETQFILTNHFVINSEFVFNRACRTRDKKQNTFSVETPDYSSRKGYSALMQSIAHFDKKHRSIYKKLEQEKAWLMVRM